jgi:hypothetical protein
VARSPAVASFKSVSAPDFIEREPQIIVPRRRWYDDPKRTRGAPQVSGLQITPTNASQQILDLVDGLHRRRRIVDGWLECLDGDIDQKTKILHECTFNSKVHGMH